MADCLLAPKQLGYGGAEAASAPSLFPLVHSAYSSPSTLFWGDKTIQSAEGVQQGDPLGPLHTFLPYN